MHCSPVAFEVANPEVENRKYTAVRLHLKGKKDFYDQRRNFWSGGEECNQQISQKAKKQQKAKQNKQTGDKQLTKRNPTGSEAVLSSDDIAERYCKSMI